MNCEHGDAWCVDDREPEIYYCPDCNEEWFEELA